MLIQTDITELGDKKLDPKEAVYREREELLSLASNRKINGQEELEDAERSCGPRMWYAEVIRRVCIESPRLLVREGSAGSVAIYRPKNYQERLDEGRDDTKPDWWNDHKYVGGMPKDWLPEYSHVILDTSNLPVREIRGWRSVLMSLIKGEALSYRGSVRQFGEAIDRRAGRWREELRAFKPK